MTTAPEGRLCPCVPVDCDGGGWVLGTDAPHAVSHINGHLACIYLLFISLVGWVFVWFMSDGHRQLAAAVRVVCDVWFAAAVACLGEFVLGADDLRLHANCDTEADHQNQQRQVGGNGGLLCCLPDAAVAGDCKRLQAITGCSLSSRARVVLCNWHARVQEPGTRRTDERCYSRDTPRRGGGADSQVQVPAGVEVSLSL